jgi:SAM-dependent methyltransferase
MEQPQIRFDNGATYEEFMGKWSRLAGDTFLDWLAPPPACAGSTSAAATAPSPNAARALRAARGAGHRPSPEQLAFARSRLAAGAPAEFRVGDAMALPYADAAFDAAVMALVIFFVPDPAKGVAEMARVVKPGAASRPTLGTSSAAASPSTRCRRRWPRSASRPLLAARASRRGGGLGGRRRALWEGAGLVSESRRARSRSSAASTEDFETSGGSPRPGRALGPRLVGDARRREGTPRGKRLRERWLARRRRAAG